MSEPGSWHCPTFSNPYLKLKSFHVVSFYFRDCYYIYILAIYNIIITITITRKNRGSILGSKITKHFKGPLCLYILNNYTLYILLLVSRLCILQQNFYHFLFVCFVCFWCEQSIFVSLPHQSSIHRYHHLYFWGVDFFLSNLSASYSSSHLHPPSSSSLRPFFPTRLGSAPSILAIPLIILFPFSSPQSLKSSTTFTTSLVRHFFELTTRQEAQSTILISKSLLSLNKTYFKEFILLLLRCQKKQRLIQRLGGSREQCRTRKFRHRHHHLMPPASRMSNNSGVVRGNILAIIHSIKIPISIQFNPAALIDCDL